MTTPTSTSEIRFTGVVVSCNEANRLRQCLASLAFCDQILLVDLQSSDGCADIGREMGATVIPHERVPYGEFARADAMPLCDHDWVVRLDPDEVLPAGAEAMFRSAIGSDANAAMLTINFQYYFRGKPMNGTRWKVLRIPVAMRKSMVRINTNVHSGYLIAEGGRTIDIPDTGPDSRVQHFWVDTYAQLFEKHNRYLKFEGKARHDQGQRFGWGTALWDSLRSIKNNLIKDRGIFCGFDGIFLSFFHAWYVFNSHLSLRRYECEIAAGGAAARS
jgi:glycosyltransferase involved in cell wall biosynthesis